MCNRSVQLNSLNSVDDKMINGKSHKIQTFLLKIVATAIGSVMICWLTERMVQISAKDTPFSNTISSQTFPDNNTKYN